MEQKIGSSSLHWWGYLHNEGSLHVKRFFDRRDLTEAWDSPFVAAVYGPWPVDNRDGAIKKLEEAINATMSC